MNPLQGSGVSERSRCGAVRILELAGEPSAGIGRVGSLAGEHSAGIGVVPCESLSSPMNPLRGSGVSERSRCGAVRILELAGQPSARIGRVGSLALRGSGVWERSRCRAVRILELAGRREEEGGGRREEGGGRREEGGGGGRREEGGGRREEGGGRREEGGEGGGGCCESPCSMLRITSGAVAGTLRPCLCSAANRSGRG